MTHTQAHTPDTPHHVIHTFVCFPDLKCLYKHFFFLPDFFFRFTQIPIFLQLLDHFYCNHELVMLFTNEYICKSFTGVFTPVVANRENSGNSYPYAMNLDCSASERVRFYAVESLRLLRSFVGVAAWANIANQKCGGEF